MRTSSRFFMWLMFAAVLTVPAILSGCEAHVSGHRYYDADYNDYHAWNNGEVVYYTQWEHDTHRDHRDFDKRSDDDRRAYWKWRHDHDRDHDHDNDRH